ncbi:alpha-2-macroglobulin family protein [Terrimonas pollutisoli]|uniref:alpha-2-macroglobulin family protein n=1 Tax=Terrimonas pollutisoli TaxID=3034147 RepID=UPI0023EC5911|nr:alpha-2-macroglobulin family protein [Terrimonas sp. H1YJ31]
MKLIKRICFFTILLSLFTMSAESQNNIKKYDAAWKRVEEFSKKNLPKSALAEVKKIYDMAKKDGSAGSPQEAQLIKSLVYMTGLQAENREDNEVFSIAEMEKEIAVSKEPVSAILNSLLAEMYWNYYQQIRWDLYNRTKTTNFNKNDIATWGADDFHKKIGELYLQSIKPEKLLQQTKLESFDAIIIKGNVRHLRPTLFDLLTHRALDYFENDERDIAKPAYAFEIDQAAAFDPAADFIHRKFSTKDSLSLQYHALIIYQKLIAFHSKDTKHDALIDADIKRIEFVRNKSVHPDKEQLYFNAINHLARQYESTPAASQAWYLLAAYYNQQADEYKPFGDTTHRYSRVKAKEICEKVLKNKAAEGTEGAINCYNLLNQLNSQSLQFSVEKVNVPGHPFRAFVAYRNVNQLSLRLIKADETLKKQLEDQYGDKYWTSILAAKPILDWQRQLPATNDLQQHSVEIKIDALLSGDYILVAGTDKEFNNKKTLLGARLFYVSNISYVNNGNDFFVLNRDNGQPLANAAVQVWEQKYDYKQSKYTKEKARLYKTDNNGFFKKEQTSQEAGKRYSNYSYLLDITYNNDRLFMNDLVYDYYYYRDNIPKEPKTSSTVFLFTDRSLYRPGQTVYFKGVVLNRSVEEKKAWTNDNYQTTIYLRDANYQDIDTIVVKTNEYGSFSGKFQLPQSGLNGDFSIYTKKDNGNAGFKVEEYKRPKFYVDYEPLKGTYKVNDTIKVTGVAKAYAGNNIDGAMVKYRVVRQPRFIYPWLFWRGWFPPTAPMEIAHGEATTDKGGKFVVKFTAIPDLKIEKKLEPVFDYTVYADITDINGETRSGEQKISVGYKSLLLKTNIPATISVDSLKTLSIRTENMNGQFEPANVKVTIAKLKEEKRLIRSRYWERPDQFVISKEEYIKNFPYDEYDNENDPKTWEKGERVFEKSDSVKQSGEWQVENGRFGIGFYVIEISTKDKNGEEVKDVKYIELYDEKSKQLATPQYLWSEGAKPIEPGEKTTVRLGTSADNLFVVQQLDKETGNQQPGAGNYSFLKLNNEKRSFDFTASEADRGGYGVSWLFVKHNRVYQYNQTIMVTWTNKELSIEYATYRDKTLPGSEEKWKLKITGYKNEKLAAEMLASMYDASLDQFYPHQWNKPSIWPTYNSRRFWNSSNNFVKVESNVKPGVYPDSKYFQKQYDQLLSTYFNEIVVVGYGKQRRALAGRVPGIEMADMNVAAAPQVEMMKMTEPKIVKDEEVSEPPATQEELDSAIMTKKIGQRPIDNSAIQIRKNFNETAFFFPNLKTDERGAIEFSFTLPEALTKWKFQALAHTKEGALGYSTKEIITQKQLMVQPNAPRFLREGDKMEFSAKIVNLADKELTGQAELHLFDATTNQPIDGWFSNMAPVQFFTVAVGQSQAVQFPIVVPYQFNKALVWRIVAKADAFSDGEENAMPVLTNRMLVTETLPLPMRGTGTKNFSFEKLLNSANSETLQHYSLTAEYTSNPVWYAVQALPYLMEYPYDCAEQTWNRYYANSLATFIANSSPRIKQVFEQWKTKDTAALLSNLQKNEELKAILLEETPWVLQAKSETEQKKNIALLFDMIRMSKEVSSSYDKLKQMQSSNGGFVWFKGGPDDRYMTQYIVTGIGHLKKLNGYAEGQKPKLDEILVLAIPYLDKKIKEDYDNLVKHKTDLTKYTPDYSIIQYLYMRSFFPEYKIANASQKAYDYFRTRTQLTWTKQNKYMQGMIVLALGRTGDAKTPVEILKSLKETAIINEELGMYWKDARRGWFWHEAPIERQALLIEAFQEIGRDFKTADDLKTWLLKNKQTNRWESTKATAEACYALLLQGTQWLTNEPSVQIKLGDLLITPSKGEGTEPAEAGTGYFKKTIDGKDVKPVMGNISVTVGSSQVSRPAGGGDLEGATYGAVYWQYFEDLDKITTASTPLQLVKKLFVEKNSDRGPVLTPVNDGDILKVGDKIKVRIELRVDREMEYVHMKDMRASAMEPVNVLSSYKWQGGLGYYESTKDASTNFFFSNLRKGTYVFEYPLFITHAGNFSNGITTILCMYAPEFSSHSEGIRINVE